MSAVFWIFGCLMVGMLFGFIHHWWQARQLERNLPLPTRYQRETP